MTKEKEMFEAVRKRNHAYFKNLPQDVNLNAQNEQGNTLLHELAMTAFVPYGIENVLKRHPDPFVENKDGMTPRMLAVWHNNMSQAAFLSALEASYTERQRRFHVRCQADIIESLANGQLSIVKNYTESSCNRDIKMYCDKILRVVECMHRNAHGREN